MSFKRQIEKMVGWYSVEEYKEDRQNGTVYFEMRGEDFTAEQLFKLSDLLGTGVIKVTPDTRYGGYCETCYFDYSVVVFEAQNVKFD